MNLYLISQNKLMSCDVYMSAVVVAETEEDARMIDPSGGKNPDNYKVWNEWVNIEDVNCKLIGTAIPGSEAGSVICADYRAS
jgi:hypothetical protein